METRQLLRNQQRNVHQRAAQLPSFRTCGGIQLFLDIPRAFDAIPRQPLFDHLRNMNINQDLVSILGSWHNDTAYITQHDQIFVETETGCGIRQGCRAAPVLWTAFTDLIFEALSQEIEPSKKQLPYSQTISTVEMFFIQNGNSNRYSANLVFYLMSLKDMG
jgi:hypothetical protein